MSMRMAKRCIVSTALMALFCLAVAHEELVMTANGRAKQQQHRRVRGGFFSPQIVTNSESMTRPQPVYPQASYSGPTLPVATYSPGTSAGMATYSPGTYTPGTYATGAYPSGMYPPGAYATGTYPPGAYTTGTYATQTYPPGPWWIGPLPPPGPGPWPPLPPKSGPKSSKSLPPYSYSPVQAPYQNVAGGLTPPPFLPVYPGGQQATYGPASLAPSPSNNGNLPPPLVSFPPKGPKGGPPPPMPPFPPPPLPKIGKSKGGMLPKGPPSLPPSTVGMSYGVDSQAPQVVQTNVPYPVGPRPPLPPGPPGPRPGAGNSTSAPSEQNYGGGGTVVPQQTGQAGATSNPATAAPTQAKYGT